MNVWIFVTQSQMFEIRKILGAKIQIKHNFKIEHEQYLNINLKKINKVVSIFFLYFSLLGNYKITTECDDNLFFQQIFHYYTHFISYRFLTDILNKELIIMKQNEKCFFDQRAEGRIVVGIGGSAGEGSAAKYGT